MTPKLQQDPVGTPVKDQQEQVLWKYSRTSQMIPNDSSMVSHRLSGNPPSDPFESIDQRTSTMSHAINDKEGSLSEAYWMEQQDYNGESKTSLKSYTAGSEKLDNSFAPPAYSPLGPSEQHYAFASPSGTSSGPSAEASSRQQAFDPAANMARFGSAYAQNTSWRPEYTDKAYLELPSLPVQFRLRQRFARAPGDIFNPPCPSFSRNPVHPLNHEPFEPRVIPGKGRVLADGFIPYYPGPVLAPRDVSLADWGRFLEDIVVAGRLTGAQGLVSNATPVIMHMGATGYFVTKAIEKRMRRRKDPIICEALAVWQERFFQPRGLKVDIIEKGKPDVASSSSASLHNDSEDGCGTPSQIPAGVEVELGSGDMHRQTKTERKDEKRERKQERREDKRERKQERREDKREWKQQHRDEKRERKADRRGLNDDQTQGYSLVLSSLD